MPVTEQRAQSSSRTLSAPRGGVVVRHEQSAETLRVDGTALVSRADEVARDLGRLSPVAQFDAAAAFRDEVVVHAQRVRAACDEPVLQVDHAHALDTERVAGAGHVDAGFAVDVAVLGVRVHAGAVVHEVQAVDVEAGELDRADARIPAALHEERGPRASVRVGSGGQVDHDAAASRPYLVQVGPMVIGHVVADAGGHESVAVALDAQVNSMPKAVSAIHDPLMRAAPAPLSLMATPTLLNAMFSMEPRSLSVCA